MAQFRSILVPVDIAERESDEPTFAGIRRRSHHAHFPVNIKRVAYELRPAVQTNPGPLEPRHFGTAVSPVSVPLPKVSKKSAPETISADALTNRIDRFLATRGLTPAAQPSATEKAASTDVVAPAQPEKFVCEDDVRVAVKTGRKLLIGERTIVTPAARYAGEDAKVFVYEGWRS